MFYVAAGNALLCALLGFWVARGGFSPAGLFFWAWFNLLAAVLVAVRRR